MSFRDSTTLPTPSASRAEGRKQRGNVPRRALGELAPRGTGYDPVERLIELGTHRVQELLPLRYQRMLASPFNFFRGSALLMADDLARGVSSDIEVQICGDAHLSNFGIFRSAEHRLVFDINDFDETDYGSFEWDVKRLATSLAIVAEQNGLSAEQQQSLAVAAAREYRLSIRRLAHEGLIKVWYSVLDVDAVMSDLGSFFGEETLHDLDTVLQTAADGSSSKPPKGLVQWVDGRPTFVSNPPLVVPLDQLDPKSELVGVGGRLSDVIRDYRNSLSPDRSVLLSHFTPVDAARKVVGVGSVATRCFIILLVGRNAKDTFFLQVKEASASAVALARGRSSELSGGARVVRGQKIMQATPDPFLGWHDVEEKLQTTSYYVREQFDHRATVRVEQLDAEHLSNYGRLCAWALARAHARSGGTSVLEGYLGKGVSFDEAIGAFATLYQERNKQDFAALQHAAAEGRISVAQ
jgi:hypothetical protein